MSSETSADAAATRLSSVFKQQHALRATGFDYDTRRRMLKDLRRQIGRYQDRLADVVSQDFGNRPAAETKMLDLMGSTLEINHILSHLRRWMKPQRRATELLFLSNALRLTYQPKGVVGIIVPWNFPVYLALGPLVAALGAGNRVMLKLSELTPRTNQVLRQMLAEIFREDEVAVIGEELTNPTLFTALPFDHLIFTGSPAIGRHVMAAAARHLTPVTLELGGKSPAVVLDDYPLADAALRVVHGKAANAGQTCVAPDHVLVPADQVEAFVAAAKRAFQAMFADGCVGNADYTTIISPRHQQRLEALLADARDKGATITACAAGADNCMPLHVVTGVSPDMRLMQEEIFGPILPVVAYDQLDEVIRHIQDGPRPLALYVFSHDRGRREHLLRQTHAGGVTLNDWGWHVMNHDVPFGGIGNSGMGSYHGVEGFRELSHARPVFKRHRWFPTHWFHAPYGRLLQRLTLRFFLGKPDSQLNSR